MSKSANDLEKLTKEKLIAKAKRMKVILSSPMLKAEIISAISKALKSAERAKKAAAKKAVAAKKISAKKSAALKPVHKTKPMATSSAKKVAAPKKAIKPAKPSAKAGAKKIASPKPAVKAKQKKSATAKSVKAKPAKAEAKAIKAKKSKTTTTATVKAARPKAKVSKPLSKPVVAVAKPKAKKVSIATADAPPSEKVSSVWKIKTGPKKFFIANEAENYADVEVTSYDLPESYGDTRIVTLARSPHTLYVYWEADADSVELAKFSLGKEWSEINWALRIYDVTNIEFDGSNANYFFDVEIDSVTKSRYLDIEQSDRDYIVAIGLKDNAGNFSRFSMSNRVHAPRAGISGDQDTGWSIPDETFLKLYALSGGGSAGLSSLGGSQFMALSEQVSSGAVSSFSASEQKQEEKERGFFFWLNCELVVYGGTEPDAAVTMMGKKIQLRPDGTFSARFALPDGVIDIPVKAVSGDRVEMREISPTVTRETRRSEEMYPELDDTPEKLAKAIR